MATAVELQKSCPEMPSFQCILESCLVDWERRIAYAVQSVTLDVGMNDWLLSNILTLDRKLL